jgi:TonB-linked SusC/RagA family outer membrane protein
MAGLFFFCGQILAQSKTITGKVTDAKDGSPLSGVSITVKGGQGTSTGNDGSYSLSIPATAKTIEFSMVGYETETRAVGSSATINVKLTSTDKTMADVVVVGYGTQQKKAFTGSSAKVNVKEFSQLVTPSIDKQLSGRAAGVDVVNVGGLVNTPARIRIRGINSITSGQDPLIIVDGVPIVSGNLALATNSNALGDINPSDIESIDVLKDGSATAIYGSRAANGVILITTKKGTKGRSSVSYEGTFGFSQVYNKFELLNAQEFVTIMNEAYQNAGQFPVAALDANGTNTDWQDNVFVKNAFIQNHTIGVSGGTNKSTYYLSMNYSDQKGVVRSNFNKAYRLRLNIDHEVNKFVKIGNNLSLSRQYDEDQNNGSNALSGAVAAALRALPNVAIYDPNGPYGYNIATNGGSIVNALGQGANLRAIENNYVNIAFVLDNNRYSSDKYRFLDVAYLELSPVKGLKIRSQFSADVFNDYSFQRLDPRHGDGFSQNGIVYNGQQTILRTNWQNYANYNISAKKHNFYFTVGHELQQTKSKFFSAQGSTVSDLFYIKENLISNSTTIPVVGGNYVESSFESLFGRFNYDYDNRYFFQASIRRDGLSSLGSANRYGNFPGFSVGWRPSQEKFWHDNVKLSNWISDVKIKASYATVGNDLGGFRYLSTYGAAPYGNIGGNAVSNVGNPDLRWETSKKLDVGIEMGIWKNRFNLTFDWFKNDIDDQILAVPTPLSAGIPNNSILKNIGTMQNTGIELAIGGDIIRAKNFTWSINANYTSVHNELKSLYPIGGVDATEIPAPGSTNYNYLRIGDPVNILWGYRFAGVNSGNGNPVYYNKDGLLVQRNVLTGSYFFANSMTDPTYGLQTSLTNADKVNLGQVQPKYFGAITNNFQYKNWNLEVMFRYSGGNKIMNVTRQETLLNLFFQNQGKELLNRWTTPGQVTDVPKAAYGTGIASNQNGETISRFVEDGSFLRLQNVVLSYTINPKTLESKTNGYIKSARFYVQGQNLFVWTKYRGIDPEAYNGFGIDNAITPPVRTVSFGVNLGF